jgi:hypothetical protein
VPAVVKEQFSRHICSSGENTSPVSGTRDPSRQLCLNPTVLGALGELSFGKVREASICVCIEEAAVLNRKEFKIVNRYT